LLIEKTLTAINATTTWQQRITNRSCARSSPRQVPHSHPAVQPRSHRPPPIGRAGHSGQPSHATLEAVHLFPARHVPHPRRSVAAARQGPLLVGREHHLAHCPLVPSQQPPLFLLQVPQPDHPVVAGRGRHLPPRSYRHAPQLDVRHQKRE